MKEQNTVRIVVTNKTGKVISNKKEKKIPKVKLEEKLNHKEILKLISG